MPINRTQEDDSRRWRSRPPESWAAAL